MLNIATLTRTLTLSCLVFLAGCSHEPELPQGAPIDRDLEQALSRYGGTRAFRMPDANDLAAIPQDPRNPLTRQKVRLGQMLFHETGLALKPKETMGLNTYSCASCHHAAAGFQAGVRQGLGEGGVGFGYAGEGRRPNPFYHIDSIDLQPLRTPSALNIAFQENVLWNGQFGSFGHNSGTSAQWTAGTPKEDNHFGYEGTEIQAIAGLKVHRMDIDLDFLKNTPIYENLFYYAFPRRQATERISRETAGLAIAAYERTLLATEAPFQRWLRGDNGAMTTTQKEGALLFFGKAGCVSCHNGPSLAEMDFHALGMNDLDGAGVYGTDPNDLAHKGRGGFTGNAAENYKFKVPQLYNLGDSRFYGHGGNFRSVEEVIRYKNEAIPQNSKVPNAQLAHEFRPLHLTDEEVRLLTDFVENGLYDPNLQRYAPDHTPSEFCFPNNDDASRADSGCL